jgi:putative endonuclease
MKYYVYILYSQSKDKYYTGYSVNPEERVVEHNLGATPSTRPGRPWLLAYTEEFDNKSAAIRRERAIKCMKSHKYIKTLTESK